MNIHPHNIMGQCHLGQPHMGQSHTVQPNMGQPHICHIYIYGYGYIYGWYIWVTMAHKVTCLRYDVSFGIELLSIDNLRGRC